MCIVGERLATCSDSQHVCSLSVRARSWSDEWPCEPRRSPNPIPIRYHRLPSLTYHHTAAKRSWTDLKRRAEETTGPVDRSSGEDSKPRPVAGGKTGQRKLLSRLSATRRGPSGPCDSGGSDRGWATGRLIIFRY